MDRITLRGIRAYGRHGANPGEREREQPFDIEMALEIDLRAAERSDELGDTLDYDALCRALVEIVESTSFFLLEALAGALATAVLADARVRSVELSVAKPGLLGGATPGVTLHRKNPRYGAPFVP
jgi:dihydroneopterin aldolase